MALFSCPECQHDVSDKAQACPHCGMPVPNPARRRMATLIGAGIVVVLVAGVGGTALALRGHTNARVEQLRAEQDVRGTQDPHVRQRFYRLYKRHPGDAMYTYLWARCVDDAAEQLALGEEGIRADPGFAWNYNIAARALARLGRVQDAYDQAAKGAALDPDNMQLADKLRSLKAMLDHKLADEATPAPGAEKGRYEGIFHGPIRSFERSDLQAIPSARVADYKGPIADALRGLVVCANPYADRCMRVLVPRDGRFKSAWPAPAPVHLKEHEMVTVTGTVVVNSRGEPILLADALTAGEK